MAGAYRRLLREVQNDNQYGYQDCRRQYGNNILSHVLLLPLLPIGSRLQHKVSECGA
jgi:hypothetical protein